MKIQRQWIFLIVLAIASLAGLTYTASRAFENPFIGHSALNYPVYATGDAEGNTYTIDNSFRRITRTGTDGVRDYRILGGQRDDDRFFYANHIAVSPGGRLYVLDELRDEQGFYVLRERLLVFDEKGNLNAVLWMQEYDEQAHDPTLVQRGRVISIEPRGENAVDIGLLGENSVDIVRIEYQLDDKQATGMSSISSSGIIASYPLEQARLWVYDLSMSGDEVSASLKDGRIVNLSQDGNHDLLYDAVHNLETEAGRVVPAELDWLGDELLFIDLESRSIRTIHGKLVLNRDIVAAYADMEDLYEYDYYRFDVGADGRIYLPVDEGVFAIDPSGQTEFIGTATLPASESLLRGLWWLSVLVAAICVVYALYLIYTRVLSRRIPPVLMNAFAVIALVAVVGGLSTFLLIDNFNSRYTDVIFGRISQMIQVFPLVIDGDQLESFDSLDEFGNESYMDIRSSILDAFNENRDEWNKGYYFALYRIIDDRLYGFMYMNGAIGPYHPFDWLGGSEDPGVYDLAQEGQVASEMITDITGEWIYGVGPVYNSQGQVVGLFETGTDLYAMTQENQRLIKDLVWELVTLWIVIMLLLVEVTVLSNLLKERKQAQIPLSDRDPGFSDGNLARPLVFLYFTAISLSVAFLPLLSQDLYMPLGNLSPDVMTALPLSIEMAFFGIATVFTGFLTQKAGWRPIFTVSLVFSALGLLASGFSRSMPMFLAARAITGLGSGMGYIALRSFINLEGRREKRDAAYSNFYSGMIAGMNVGLVLGASLASFVGYSAVFFIGFGLVLICALVFLLLYRDTKFFYRAAGLDDIGFAAAVFKLTKSPRVWLYFILLLLPTYVAASYVAFYFPLFAESQGLSTSQIGRFMIMNGLFIVYLGPPLSRFVESKLGTRWGSMLGSIFWGVSLVLAGFVSNVVGAAIVLVLMGLTEGFAVSSQNGLYFREPAVIQAGEDRATGYFELFGKIGETIGPMLFAAVLVLGRQLGLGILGASVIVLAVPYILFVRRKQDDTHSEYLK